MEYMISEKIITIVKEKGLKKINVNINNFYLYYKGTDGSASVVMVFDCPFGTEFTEGQYRNIKRQVYQNFRDQNYFQVQILSILCTAHVETVKSICDNEDDYWFVDTAHSRLVLFENQISDFLGLRNDIEKVLFKEYTEQVGINKQSERYTNQADNRSYQPDSNTFQSENYADRENLHEKYKTRKYHGRYPVNSSKIKYFSQYNTILILINVIVFLITLPGAARNSYHSVDAGALYWPAVLYNHEYYRVFTYMFLHAGIEHIANNMLVLFVIGDNLERAVGKWKFLVIYFGAGILAGISSMSYNMLKQMNTVSVGASGAIFGVVGAMAYIVAVNRGRLENISTRQMVVFVLFSLYGGLTSQGVDNAAHIGGLVSGIVLAAIFYRKPKITYGERG
jgi:rhomboid protease GluP